LLILPLRQCVAQDAGPDFSELALVEAPRLVRADVDVANDVLSGAMNRGDCCRNNILILNAVVAVVVTTAERPVCGFGV